MDIRKPVPDMLKGVAVLLMIQVHLTELFATQGFYESVWGNISLFLGGPPAAPVFMAVMGYFIMSGSGSVVKSVLRGIRLVLLGFALNVALNANALVQIIAGNLSMDPLRLIFGVDILFLAGMSVIVIALIKPVLKKHYIAGILIGCVVAGITPLLRLNDGSGGATGYVLAFIGGGYNWSYFPLFPWLAYPLAGCSFYLFEKRYRLSEISSKYLIAGILISLLLIVPSGLVMVPVATDLHRYYHHGILFFLWTLMVLLGWSAVFLFFARITGDNVFSRLVGWIGRNVTVFYVLQWIIIGNMGTWLYRGVQARWLPVYFFAIVIVTGLGVWAWRAVRVRMSRDRLF